MGAELTPGTGNQPPDLSSLCLAITEHAPLPKCDANRRGQNRKQYFRVILHRASFVTDTTWR
jgi:hypothetical protein